MYVQNLNKCILVECTYIKNILRTLFYLLQVKRKVFDVRMEKRQSCSSILSFMTTNFERRALKGNDYFMDIEYSNLLHGLKNSQPDEDMPSLSKLQGYLHRQILLRVVM